MHKHWHFKLIAWHCFESQVRPPSAQRSVIHRCSFIASLHHGTLIKLRITVMSNYPIQNLFWMQTKSHCTYTSHISLIIAKWWIMQYSILLCNVCNNFGVRDSCTFVHGHYCTSSYKETWFDQISMLSFRWINVYGMHIGGGQEPRLAGFYDNSYVTHLASTPNSIIPVPGVSGLRKEGGVWLGA